MYMPGKHLLFKMMRASLGCRSEKDLWFNRNHDHADECSSSHSDHHHHEGAEPPKEESDNETPRLREHTPDSGAESSEN